MEIIVGTDGCCCFDVILDVREKSSGEALPKAPAISIRRRQWNRMKTENVKIEGNELSLRLELPGKSLGRGFDLGYAYRHR